MSNLAALALAAAVAVPTLPDHPSEDYMRGLCDGQRLVLHAIQENRTHWRKLLEVDTAKDRAKGGVNELVRIIVNSADSYLIPPAQFAMRWHKPTVLVDGGLESREPEDNCP